MTISSQTRKAGPFAGDGATVAYPFSFKVFTSADLMVVQLDGTSLIESTLVLDTDYTVSLNTNQDANPGGTVTLTTAPPTGDTLVITSDIGYLQPTDLTNQGGFYPKVITDALDRLTIQAQQLKEEVDRAAKLRITAGEDAQTLVDNINNLADVLSGITTVAVPYQVFSGDGATVNFTLSSAPTSLAAIEVYVSGACKIPGTDYTLNGTTLTFAVAPPNAADNIFARWIQVQATTAIEDGAVSTAKIAPSAVTTDKIEVLAITTGRIANGAVTSAKLDSGGVTLPAGSVVQVPDPADDSAKPAPTQWVRDYVDPTLAAAIAAAKVAYLEYRDEKAAGTSAGNATSGSWFTRTLNTEHADAGGHGTLSANQVQLAAGTYEVHIRVPGYAVGRHQARLRNITDGSTTLAGSAAVTVSTATDQSDTVITGRFTIASAKTFEVQQQVASSQTNGLGVASNFGETEVYTVARFWKVA